MPAGLSLYRALTAAAGALLAPPVRLVAPRGSALRESLSPAGPEVEEARGSAWVHAASMGEVVAARRWVETLAAHGARLPVLLTTRTSTGLTRARAELAVRAIARIAPADLPGPLRDLLRRASPARLDILETELWPNLLHEARRANVPVLFVSGTVSGRSAGRLARSGLAGPALLGEGVWVLAQTERDAARFRELGVPSARVAVTGDLKAEPPGAPGTAPSRRAAVVLGSVRPGEEGVAIAVALAAVGRGRACVAAPRHPEEVARLRAAAEEAHLRADVRDEEARPGVRLRAWIESLSPEGRGPLGILATRGELAAAYEEAALAVVGGTFAPFGGHNPMEPAARGCPILVGPDHGNIEGAVAALASAGALEVVRDAEEAAARVDAWLSNPEALDRAGGAARAVAAEGARAAERAWDAMRAFGLAP